VTLILRFPKIRRICPQDGSSRRFRNIVTYRQTYVASYSPWSHFIAVHPANIQLCSLDLKSSLSFLMMLKKCKQSILVSTRKSPVRESVNHLYITKCVSKEYILILFYNCFRVSSSLHFDGQISVRSLRLPNMSARAA